MLALLVPLELLVDPELVVEPPLPVVLELPKRSDPEPQPIERDTIDPMTTTASDASFAMSTSKE